MTQFSAYLTTEVVEDYSDGIINRREALRRLGLLGFAVAVAVPLLAACAAPGPTAHRRRQLDASAPRARPVRRPSRPRRSRFAGPEGRTLQAAWAAGRRPSRRGAGRPREPRPHRPHPLGRRPAGRRAATRRWPSTCCRPRAAPVVRRRGRGHGGAERVPASRFIADLKAAVAELRAAGVRRPGRRRRLLLRRRHGLDAAGRRRAAARRRRPVLRSAAGRRRLRRLPERRRPRRLRRAGRRVNASRDAAAAAAGARPA